MKQKFSILLCALFFAGLAIAQTKPKPPVKPPLHELEKILTGIGLPYKVVNDSLAVVPYGGENVESFQVVIQRIGDLYIVFSNLSEALPGKLDETKYKYLLQMNDNFDVVKIGMSAGDNTIYLRADLYKSGTNTTLLKRVITQVANVTNIIGGDLK